MHKTSLFVIAATLFSALIFVVTPDRQAEASIYAGKNTGWLVIASRSDANGAISLARRYVREFPSSVVFRSSNGYYGVSLGWARRGEGQRILDRLLRAGKVPPDSYLHSGQRWVEPIWSGRDIHHLSRSRFLSGTRISYGTAGGSPPANPNPTQDNVRVTELDPRPAIVHGLRGSGDDYLSLRRGPSTRYSEIARMRERTPLTVTGKSSRWYRVQLSNGTLGWAYSKYVKFDEVPIIGPDETIADKEPEPEPKPEPEPEKEIAEEKPPEPPEPEVDDKQTAENDDKKPGIGKVPADQKRVALVIGNAKYEHTTALANPGNDADKVASSLEMLGFEVIKGVDLDKSGMESRIRSFVRAMSNADVTLFFYAGHAMQVNGANYLIPIDAKLEDETALDFETINLSTVLTFMNDRDRISLALLDACRDNPLARNFTRGLGASRSVFVGRGLAPPTAGAGEMLIGFATAPGEVAFDGEGSNSPFTTGLLKHIQTPGVEVELMLKRVKAEVFDLTEGKQSPWHNSALRKEFYFSE